MFNKKLLLTSKSEESVYSRFLYQSGDINGLYGFLNFSETGDNTGSYIHLQGEPLWVPYGETDIAYCLTNLVSDGSTTHISFPLGVDGNKGICKTKSTGCSQVGLNPTAFGVYGNADLLIPTTGGELVCKYLTYAQAQVGMQDPNYEPDGIPYTFLYGKVFGSDTISIQLCETKEWEPPVPVGDHVLSFRASESVVGANYFKSYSTVTQPDSACSVIINGVKTEQKFTSLSFNANDVVTIEMKGVMSFPIYKPGTYIKEIFAPLPFFSDVDGAGVSHLSQYFEGCTGLTSVPGRLFANNPSFQSLNGAFKNSGLTTIPENLFEGVENVIACVQAFENCTNLQEIPEGLFSYNPKLENVNNAFNGCTGLAAIPDKLFYNNTELYAVSYTFNGCTGLTTLPNDLFVNNTKLASFTQTFAHCENLIDIPPGLFQSITGKQSDNSYSYVYFDHTFNSCYKLTSIPKDLFANVVHAGNFAGTFSFCYNLKSVPVELFSKNLQAKQFDGTFSGCQSLTSVPEGLFANNAEALNFSSCFSICTKLASVPANLFVNNSKATDFGTVFWFCKSLTSVPENLFAKNLEVTTFNQAFRECIELTSVPENLFLNNAKVTDFSSTFEDCAKLSGRIKIGSAVVTDATDFCKGAGAITVIVPAGSTTETTFRAYAETVTNLTVETY